MRVIDAGVVVAALTGDDGLGARARSVLTAEPAAAPSLIDLEVVSAMRRMVHREGLALGRARAALSVLGDLAIDRVHHQMLLGRCWELRANLTTYDASYVALAELRKVPLMTTDRRLASAPGPRCPIEVL